MIPKEKIEKAAAVANDYTAIGYCTAFNDGFQCGVNFAETELQNIIAEFVIWISNNRCYAVISEIGLLWYVGRSDISYTYTELFAKFMAERGQA